MEKNDFENLPDLLNQECILNIFLPDCIAVAERSTLYRFSYTLLIIIVTFFLSFPDFKHYFSREKFNDRIPIAYRYANIFHESSCRKGLLISRYELTVYYLIGVIYNLLCVRNVCNI